MLKNFQKLDCRMGVKGIIYILIWIFFSVNLGSMSEEQRECFHQKLKKIKIKHQERSGCSMMADYCWS